MFSLLREDIPDFKNLQNYKKLRTLLLTKKNVPQLMIEVKTKFSGFSKSLLFFYDRYGISGKQLCLNLKQPQQMKGKKVFLEDMETFLLNLKT